MIKKIINEALPGLLVALCVLAGIAVINANRQQEPAQQTQSIQSNKVDHGRKSN